MEGSSYGSEGTVDCPHSLHSSYNQGALFPLVIHLNVCVCFLECTHIDAQTHMSHKATLLCNRSLSTGCGCFVFCLFAVL